MYLFKDKAEHVLYVGKAKDIRKRVLSYLIRTQELSHRIRLLLRSAQGLDIVVTNNENEAFILERNLIKKYMPKFNIVLRDDKQYPLLRIDPKEPYPTIGVVRRMKNDQALYFGPYSSANAMREALRVIHKVFPIRKCKGPLKPRSRPCVNFQMKRCLGPCQEGLVDAQTYNALLRQVVAFLQGKVKGLLEELRQEMHKASEALEFEKAALLRDRIKAIQRVVEPQSVTSSGLEDKDVLGISLGEGHTHVVVMGLRGGLLQNVTSHRLTGSSTLEEGLEAFVKQYYPNLGPLAPGKIVLPTKISEVQEIEEWLRHICRKPISLKEARDSSEKRLVKMAMNNAKRLMEEWENKKEQVLLELQKHLHLRRYPKRIECVDISNLFGSQAVGAVVCFVDGRPSKSNYRSFIIKEVKGIDDYSMMREVVLRRIGHGDLPDLLLLDGGKGHLNAVAALIQDLNLPDPPELASIAKGGTDPNWEKEEDKIYILGRKDPVRFSPSHPVLHFLMSIRDEAHRRAIQLHRKRALKEIRESSLAHIPHLGPKRIQLLLSHFGSVEAIRDSSPEELAKLPGISLKLGQTITQFLRQQKN